MKWTNQQRFEEVITCEPHSDVIFDNNFILSSADRSDENSVRVASSWLKCQAWRFIYWLACQSAPQTVRMQKLCTYTTVICTGHPLAYAWHTWRLPVPRDLYFRKCLHSLWQLW